MVSVPQLDAHLAEVRSRSRPNNRTPEWLRQTAAQSAPVLIWAVLPENTWWHAQQTRAPVQKSWRCGVAVRLTTSGTEVFLLDVLVDTFDTLSTTRVRRSRLPA